MKWIRRYNESVIIKATDKTIKGIVHSEIDKLGDGGDLNHIDVSGVTIMSYLFYDHDFNGDISSWNVGNVSDMSWMFRHSEFNGDISNWNVGSVTNMNCMFSDSPFNGDISNWNVGSVINMNSMFYNSPFNGDISNWNVQNVRDMSWMFNNSSLVGREPWWYILRREFIDIKSMYDSIEVYEWIDSKRKIIWKKRLNYALQDFGKEGYKIPESIWGFIIQ